MLLEISPYGIVVFPPIIGEAPIDNTDISEHLHSFFRHRAIAHLSTPICNPLRTLVSVRQLERVFVDWKLMMLFHIRFYALVVTHPVLFHEIAYNADSTEKFFFIGRHSGFF